MLAHRSRYHSIEEFHHHFENILESIGNLCCALDSSVGDKRKQNERQHDDENTYMRCGDPDSVAE